MALQELSPPPQITGPSALGGALLGISDRYAQTTRQDQLLEQQRKHQDELLLGERAYQDRRDLTQRQGRLEDDQTLLRQRATEAGIQVLINEGLLDPTQRDSREAVAAAYQTAKQNGLEKMYSDLLTVPGPGGKPLLTIADLQDKTKVDAAKGAYNQMRASQLQRELDLPARMTEDANSVAAQFQKVSEEEAGVLRQLQEVDQVLERGGAPTQDEVRAKALQLATAQKIAENQKRWGISRALTGEQTTPSNAEIEAQIPAAMETTRVLKLETALSRQEGLRRQLEGVRAIRQSLAQQQNTLRQQKAYPTRSTGGEVLQSPAAPPPQSSSPVPARIGSPMSGFLQMLEQEAAARGVPRMAPATSAPTTAPTSPVMGSSVAPVPAQSPAGARAVMADPYRRELTPGSPEEAAARAFIEASNARDNAPLFPNAIWNTSRRNVPVNQILVDPGLDPQANAGRPITPSADIFPTSSPWWAAVG